MALSPCITDLPTNEENQVPDGGTTDRADDPGKAAYDDQVRQIAQSDCLFHFHNLAFFVRAAGRSPLPKLSSGQEVLIVVVIQIGEVVLSTAVTTERGAVRELLDVVQAARDATIAVAVECVEIHAGSADDPGVQLGAVEDRVTVRIHHTRLRGAVGIHEVGVLVGVVTLALLVAIPQRSLDILQRGYELAAALEFALALVVSRLDRKSAKRCTSGCRHPAGS